jgi:hypothetical protein
MPRKHKLPQHLLLVPLLEIIDVQARIIWEAVTQLALGLRTRFLGASRTRPRTALLGSRHATCAWVANEISGRLQDTPSYRPKEITSAIRRGHGVSVPYMQAWREKERAYQALKSNPGSTADLEIY